MSQTKRLFFINTISLRTQVALYFAVLTILGLMFWPAVQQLARQASVFRSIATILGT